MSKPEVLSTNLIDNELVNPLLIKYFRQIAMNM